MRSRKFVLGLVFLAILLSGCRAAAFPERMRVESITPSRHPDPVGDTWDLTDAQVSTLLSLEQLDDYPLYRMEYTAAYPMAQMLDLKTAEGPGPSFSWGCSLFASLGDQGDRLYGRNFDWEFSPALLLFTHPPAGYASVSIVDIAYLGFDGELADDLVNRPLDELLPLLQSPWLPFDGMNEMGLAVGMAAVPPGDMPVDPTKPKIGSVRIIREILDHASDVNQALEILKSYQIDFEGGPPLHYLVADRTGRSLLIEFYQGEIRVIPNLDSWHQATNFLVSSYDETDGVCSRYDKIQLTLSSARGNLTPLQALSLLGQVSQESTQWSVVYDLEIGNIQVVMGRDQARVIRQALEMSETSQ